MVTLEITHPKDLPERYLDLPFEARQSGSSMYNPKRTIYLDNLRREEADLLLVNLNLMDGVHARIFEDAR